MHIVILFVMAYEVLAWNITFLSYVAVGTIVALVGLFASGVLVFIAIKTKKHLFSDALYAIGGAAPFCVRIVLYFIVSDLMNAMEGINIR